MILLLGGVIFKRNISLTLSLNLPMDTTSADKPVIYVIRMLENEQLNSFILLKLSSHYYPVG
jgi:hypothetical protein